jgi:branched-chain amino acid transport system permease protein
MGACLLVLPLALDLYHVIVLSSALAFAIACLSFNLLFGYTGLLSLGHALYFGLGAYAGAFLFTFGDVTSFELYLGSGILVATTTATVFGAACARATRGYFTILTLALGQIVHSLFVSGFAFRPFGTMGRGFFFIGHGGLYLPRLAMAGTEPLPETFLILLYYVAAAALLVTIVLLWRVVESPFGMALRAIRDNETRAAFIGIPVWRYRWAAFVIAAAFAALAGGLSGQIDRQVTPQQLSWWFSAQIVVASVLGGTRHFLGPVLGAFVVVALKEASLRFPIYHNLVLGIMLVAVVRLFPDGLAGATARFFVRLGGLRRPLGVAWPRR